MRRATVASVTRELRSVASAAESANSSRSRRAAVPVTAEDVDMDAAPMEDTLTCVSVLVEGPQIAFACYDEERNSILLEQSYANGYDTEQVAERFLAIAQPNLVLVGNHIAGNAPLLEVLTRPTTTLRESTVPQKPATSRSRPSRRVGPTPYRLLKSGAFDHRRCKALILQKLRVLSLLRGRRHVPPQDRGAGAALYQGAHQRERGFAHAGLHGGARVSTYHALAAVIDFDSRALVRALGALLSFLQSTIFRLEEGGTITVNAVEHVDASMFMRFSPGALNALHIFTTDHHPLMAKEQGHSKEGFSLFSLLDRTMSKVGKSCLREWMLKPLLDPKAIAARQDGVELFLRPEFQVSVGALLNLLGSIGAVDKILIRMQKCHTAPMDFIVLARTLSAALDICNILTNDFLCALNTATVDQGVPVNESLKAKAEAYRAFVEPIVHRCCVDVLRDIQERIASIVDEPMTLEMKDTVVIMTGFHEELDAAKETYEHLDETLSSVGNTILEKYKDVIQQLNVIFLPQVGFLIALDKRQHAHNEETSEFPDLPAELTCICIHEEQAYFKNEDMEELDAQFGDLDAYIKDTESLIVSELEDDILDCETELRDTFSALATLDVILSFASCAADLEFVRPTVVDPGKSMIDIKNGRHPLQELISETEYIANHTNIDERDRVNVLTGPNFSGKSCYTRQVGILVYMAHIGCFLPCESATISVKEQILARINSFETCAVPQSSFQLDLTQMGTILRRASPTSLVLIDEFGKGTSPSSGIAVLAAALGKLSSINCTVICTTHFLELFSLGILRDGQGGVKALRMAVHLPRSQDDDDDDDDDDPTPLFKLESGVSSSSAGLVCAQAAGLRKSVVDRAQSILCALHEGTQVPPKEDNDVSTRLSEKMKRAFIIFFKHGSWRTPESDEKVRELKEHLHTP